MSWERGPRGRAPPPGVLELPTLKNYGSNLGYDYGGRLMARGSTDERPSRDPPRSRTWRELFEANLF